MFAIKDAEGQNTKKYRRVVKQYPFLSQLDEISVSRPVFVEFYSDFYPPYEPDEELEELIEALWEEHNVVTKVVWDYETASNIHKTNTTSWILSSGLCKRSEGYELEEIAEELEERFKRNDFKALDPTPFALVFSFEGCTVVVIIKNCEYDDTALEDDIPLNDFTPSEVIDGVEYYPVPGPTTEEDECTPNY